MPEERRQTPPVVAGRVVVVGNLKGGSGKSTLVMNLAGALAERGRQVAILDCDPQGTATSWGDRGGTVRVRYEPLKNLNGAGGWLATASAMRREVDVLILDLPAVVAPAMGAAFMIADVILIPVAPQAVDIEGEKSWVKVSAGDAAKPSGAATVIARGRSRCTNRWTSSGPPGRRKRGPPDSVTA